MPNREREETNAVEIVREMFEAAAEHGPRVLVDRYGDWFGDEFVWESALLSSLDGETRGFRGKDELAAFWDEWYEGWDDVRLGEASFDLLDDNWVLIRSSLHVRGATSGVPIDTEVAYLCEVGNGLIHRVHTFFSHEEARRYHAHA